jgi:hypothetical protein
MELRNSLRVLHGRNLVDRYASEYLCRPLDILHVATATVSGIKPFVDL